MTSTRRVSRTHKGEAEFLLSCKYRRSCEENLLLEYYNWFLPSIMSTGFRLSDRHLHLMGLLTSSEKPMSGQQEVSDFSTLLLF